MTFRAGGHIVLNPTIPLLSLSLYGLNKHVTFHSHWLPMHPIVSRLLTPIRQQTRLTSTFMLCAFCVLLGLALSLIRPEANVIAQAQTPDAAEAEAIGTIDPIPERFQLGAELYLESCTSCHVGVPPQTLPVQTWQLILDDPEHYGVRIPPLMNPSRLIIWQYVQHFSRSIKEGEPLPYHLAQSRYFKALHPRVNFEEDVTLRQCISCHPGANGYNFRQLTPDWTDAP